MLRKILYTIAILVVSTIHSFAADQSLTGQFQILWGDPPLKSRIAPVEKMQLVDEHGVVTPLQVDPVVSDRIGGILLLNGKTVSLSGNWNGDQFRVSGARAEKPRATRKTSLKFLNVLCAFSNTAAPHPNNWYQDIMSSSYSAMSSYWNQVSFGTVSANSKTVGWYKMRRPRSYYVQDTNGDGLIDTFNHSALVKDCMDAADPDVTFTDFDFINLWFNDSDDWQYSWGGRWDLKRDGQSKTYGVTELASWTNSFSLAHEIGHAQGLPHSSGKYQDTYDSPWDVMSDGYVWDSDRHPFGNRPVHTIAFHKELLGWIPADHIYTAQPGSDKIIRISRLEVSARKGSYLVANIPMGKSATRFYTVESRLFSGYDHGLPGQAIIIHDVNTNRTDRLARVMGNYPRNDVQSPGAMFTPGESFVDVANKIHITILSIENNDFLVRITVGN